MVKPLFLVAALASLAHASVLPPSYGDDPVSSSSVPISSKTASSSSTVKSIITSSSSSSMNYGQDPTSTVKSTSSVKSTTSSAVPTSVAPPPTSSVPSYGTEPVASSSTVKSTGSSVVPAPTNPTYGDEPVDPIVPPKNGTCNAAKNTTYAAVLFEQTQFDGVMHWIDGASGECRGLSGVNVGSVRFVSEAGGNIVTKKVSDAYAKGVTLTFFDDYACRGSEIEAVKGNTPKMTDVLAKSVRIECNGQGEGTGAAILPPPPVAIRLYASDNCVGNFSSQTDGTIDECRGLSGSPIHSAQFLANVNQTVAMSNAESMGYSVVFYEEFGCGGKRLGAIVGNKMSIRPITAKSLKFVQPPVAVAVALEASVDQLTSAGTAVNTLAGAITALTAGSLLMAL